MSAKQVLIVILFVLSFVFYYNLTEPTSSPVTARVTQIIDGDTIKTDTFQSIRLLGINAPEKNQPYYKETHDLMVNLIQNKTIRVEAHGLDKYKRTLAYIFSDNKNINAQLLMQGLATLYYYDKDEYYEELREAEEFARENELGLWRPSPNSHCIKIVEFEVSEPEHLVLKNSCSFPIDITYKDDATHIYDATILADSEHEKNFSHIWNTDGDSIYIYDNKGLILFYRY